MIPNVLPSGKGKTLETAKEWVVARGYKEGGMNRWSTEDLNNSEVFCVAFMMGACHCTLVKTHRMKILRVSLNVNYRLWAIIRCQFMFIDCNKHHFDGGLLTEGGMCM